MKLDANFSAAIDEIVSSRGVPKTRIIEALVEGVRAAYERNHGPTPNLDVEVNLNSGIIEAFLNMQVVAEVSDSQIEISVDEAHSIDENAESGDIIQLQTEISRLGNLAIHSFKQRVKALIREAERDKVMELYGNRLFELINCTVLYTERGDVFVETPDKIEGIVPYKEQIPRERLAPYQRIKCLLTEVRNVRKAPMLVFSRAHQDLLRELMKNEVPEVREGNIELVAISRDPGQRSKVAVRSKLRELDPVGSCIGSRGIRITAISHDLNDEKIDLVLYKEDPFEFIAEALSPAKVLSVEIFEEERRGLVIVPDDQISLAIGKGWRNVKLASKLTRYYLDVKSVSEMAALNIDAGAHDPPRDTEDSQNSDETTEAGRSLEVEINVDEVSSGLVEEGEDQDNPAKVDETDSATPIASQNNPADTSATEEEN